MHNYNYNTHIINPLTQYFLTDSIKRNKYEATFVPRGLFILLRHFVFFFLQILGRVGNDDHCPPKLRHIFLLTTKPELTQNKMLA